MPGGGGIGRPLGPSGGRGGGGGGTGLPDGLIGGRGAARFCGASVAGAAAAVVAGGADAGLAGGAPTGVGAGADAAAGGATEGAAGAGAGAAGVGAAGGAVGRELIRREERAGISGDCAADDPGADVAGAPTRGGGALDGSHPRGRAARRRDLLGRRRRHRGCARTGLARRRCRSLVDRRLACLGRLLGRGGLFWLDRATQALGVGLTPDAVGLGILDGG